MNYRERLFERYWSTHYRYFEPDTPEAWASLVDRLALNFDEFFERLPRDAPILDVPCGVGYVEAYLAAKGFDNICALDISEEQIGIARDRLSRLGNAATKGRINFVVGDAFDHLRSATGYKAIAVIDFLEHLPKAEIVTLLDLCRNALEPTGLLFVRVSNADHPFGAALFYRDFTHETPFTTSSLRQCLLATGFEHLALGYERVPEPRSGSVFADVMYRLYQRRRSLLAWWLEIPVAAFAENLVAVARKM